MNTTKNKPVWIAVTTTPGDNQRVRVEYITRDKSDAESIVGMRVIGPVPAGVYAVGDLIVL